VSLPVRPLLALAFSLLAGCHWLLPYQGSSADTRLPGLDERTPDQREDRRQDQRQDRRQDQRQDRQDLCSGLQCAPGPVCGDGTCDASSENGATCGRDCCDALTPCNQTYQNMNTQWCRDLNKNGYKWFTRAEGEAACPLSGCGGTGLCNGKVLTCHTRWPASPSDGWDYSGCDYCGDGWCDSASDCDCLSSCGDGKCINETCQQCPRDGCCL
jgi:hypothetical protein